MRALILVAVGVLFVGLEFRTDAVDLLADPAGWALVAAGAWLLAARWTAALASVAALLSVAGAFLGFEYVLIDPATGDPIEACPAADVGCEEQLRYHALSLGRGLAITLGVVAGGAALVLLLRKLRTGVGDRGSQLGLRNQLAVLEVLVPVVWVLPVVIAVVGAVGGDDGFDPVWNGPWLWFSAARNLLMVWLAVVLLFFANAFPKRVREQRFDFRR